MAKRKPWDHGTAEQAIEWALDHNPDGEIEAATFLRRWQQGDLAEWPEFYAWLDAGLAEARAERRRLKKFRLFPDTPPPGVEDQEGSSSQVKPQPPRAAPTSGAVTEHGDEL